MKYDSFFMSEEQIEQLKRKKNWNKKMAKSAKWFLIAIATGLLNSVPAIASVNLISWALEGLQIFGVFYGVCNFSKSLHDPLTEKEAQELAEREEIEKGGRSR